MNSFDVAGVEVTIGIPHYVRNDNNRGGDRDSLSLRSSEGQKIVVMTNMKILEMFWLRCSGFVGKIEAR